jgi:hypothetical protein
MENSRVRCRDCYYYDKFSYMELRRKAGAKKEEDDRGICRRFGPVTGSAPTHQVVQTRLGFKKWFRWIYVATVSNFNSTLWPSVVGDFDWCGEFKQYLCDEKNGQDPYFLDPTESE